MLAILSLLVIVTLSILVTRVATLALAHTGLSRESARFQARSAFTGAGFTTNESERVVAHPVRRRIILFLMLLGNAGIVTAVSSLILTFVNDGGSSFALKIVLLMSGLALLWTLAMSHWVDRHLSWMIERVLQRYTDLDVKDYANLMNLTGDYRIAELRVAEEGWLANRTLGDVQLRDEGVVVLDIRREDGSYLGAPKGSTEIHTRDTMIIYGRTDTISELDQRRRDSRGDRKHEQRVAEQKAVEQEEEQEDARAEK
jgi:hypothetical protein